ncbi:hypothetical protein LCGC14_0527480 [marine sediment metagenome]|uniref:Uncharacterized protein n=1 Tax=marine sediment metagenome TaxID=412755 RepID=A0A0F9SF18_9ZZZZ
MVIFSVIVVTFVIVLFIQLVAKWILSVILWRG